jgi:anti-sigma-K factor RskA
MKHVDPELLALLALGEEAGSASDRAHLEACAECRDELENLRRAVTVGRSTLGSGELLEPDPRVWAAIQGELGRAPAAPVIPLRRRRWVAPLAAVAAATVVVAGAAGIWAVLRPAPPTVLAEATLDPFPGWPDALGEAVVAEQSDGARVVDVTLTAPDAGGFREVWLISSDASQLVSLGVLRGSEGSFTIPDGLDLGRFALVDVSEEPFDGDPAHSGDSIVRGELAGV